MKRSTVAVYEDGTEVSLVPFGNESRLEPISTRSVQCYHCGVPVGFIHELGCTIEECPACGEMYIFCACRTEEKQEYYEKRANDFTETETHAKHIQG